MVSKPPSTSKERKPPGPCFKCSKERHGACSWLKPRLPPGPCPSCGIKGHWKVDCPNPSLGIRTSTPGPEQESSNPALPSLLGLTAEDWRWPGPQTPTLITSMEPSASLTVAGSPTSPHQPNYPQTTSNSLRWSKTLTSHKSPWPTFQPFLISPPRFPCPTGSSYRRLTFSPYPKSKRLEW